MRHWSQLATRNWRARPLRNAGAVLAIALGTAAVVWVSCCYESVRQTVLSWAGGYIGNSHINVQSPIGKYDTIPERIVPRLEQVHGVDLVAPKLVQRLPAIALPADKVTDEIRQMPWRENLPEVDVHGIDLVTELEVRTYNVVAGRMLKPDDDLECVLERAIAEESGVGLGDDLIVWPGRGGGPAVFRIVGLVEQRRVGRFQPGIALVRLPVLQRVCGKQGLITSADVMLIDPSLENVERSAALIRNEVRKVVPNATVSSAEKRIRQIQSAQRQQEFVIILLSSVVMLTALIIILSTLSIGMIERIGQLGLLRCIGMTRGQLATLVMAEVIPLGALGIGLGVPIGVGLALLTVWLVPDYVGEFAWSPRGVFMAAASGLITTIVAATLPTIAATTVSPLEAAHPRARRAKRGTLLVVTVIAGLLLIGQHFYVLQKVERSLTFVNFAAASVVLLYVGYALLAPIAVWLVGSLAVRFISRIIRIRTKLLQDQVGHAIWRSAGICCGLMVGLSLVVGLVGFNASLTRGWQFPKQFPAAYIWSFDQLRPDAREVIEDIPDLGAFTVANAVNVIVEERRGWMDQLLLSVTWFVGCDPNTFFDLVHVQFTQGDPRQAIAQLREGGCVLVAEDFARARNKKLGDNVRVFFGNLAPVDFKIVGVIESPALDIAAGFFQAHSEMHVAASGSVLGTNADMQRYFGVKGSKLVLLNFDLPADPNVPEGWPPPRDSDAGRRLPRLCYDDHLSRVQRYRHAQEGAVLTEIKSRLGAPQAFTGTARELKDEIDNELNRITLLLTAVPSVALIVAAIGVANLMTANVASRAKQFAMLRAIGATRDQILRMVIGEALVLGVLGSAMGTLLGVHLTSNLATMFDRMWGLKVTLALPWGTLGVAVVLTVGLCVIAGVLPARHAARTNIVDALHVA